MTSENVFLRRNAIIHISGHEIHRDWDDSDVLNSNVSTQGNTERQRRYARYDLSTSLGLSYYIFGYVHMLCSLRTSRTCIRNDL